MKLVIAGDLAPRARAQEMLDNNNYFGCFKDVKNILAGFDYAIVNFETNIPTPYSQPIEKNGPNLKTTPEVIDLIKYLGFNVVTLANNHFYDYGDDAVNNTISLLDRADIRHVGGGRNITEARKILFLKKDNETIALINACEHEFSIANDTHGGSYGIDPIKIYQDIKLAKEQADYIIVIIHGGHEHFQLPSLRMQEWYRFFIEVGADVVVNHHQHCFSGMEEYKGKPIYYGLGNFLFDLTTQNKRTSWNEGILLELEFSNKKIYHKPIPYIQFEKNPSIDIIQDTSDFIQRFEKLNSIISNRDELSKNIDNFYKKNRKGIYGIFQPYFGRILKSAYYRGFLPSLLSKKKQLAILNLTECESHLDRLRYNFRNRIK